MKNNNADLFKKLARKMARFYCNKCKKDWLCEQGKCPIKAITDFMMEEISKIES